MKKKDKIIASILACIVIVSLILMMFADILWR